MTSTTALGSGFAQEPNEMGIDEISRSIGGLEQSVKSLAHSLDHMRQETDRDFTDMRRRLDELKTSHDQHDGSRRTLAILWGAGGGLVASVAGVIATKLGLK